MGWYNKLLAKSIWVFHMSASPCNNCDIEILDLLTPKYDIERFGIKLVGSVRHPDVILLSGVINQKVAPQVKKIYEHAAKPCFVVGVGSCPASGCCFNASYNIVPKREAVIPYLGLLNMRRLYAEGHRVQLMPVADLADADWVAVVSNMGAPLVGQARLTDSRTIARAVSLMEEHTGHRFRAIMAVEIGGGNSIQPLMAAAHLGRPFVDADMMGRAYPEAQMTSMAVGDLRPYPLTTVDVRGLESIVERVPTWKWMERVSRKICVEYGSIASTCKAPRTGAEVKAWGIHGTTTKAIAIGRAVREAQRRHTDPVEAILSVEPGTVLYYGWECCLQPLRYRQPTCRVMLKRRRTATRRPTAIGRHQHMPARGRPNPGRPQGGVLWVRSDARSVARWRNERP